MASSIAEERTRQIVPVQHFGRLNDKCTFNVLLRLASIEADLERSPFAEGAEAAAEGGTASTSELSITPPLSPPCSPPAWNEPRAATRAKGTTGTKEGLAVAAAPPLSAAEPAAAPSSSVRAVRYCRAARGAVGCLLPLLLLAVLLYRAATQPWPTPGFPLLGHLAGLHHPHHPGLGADADAASASASASASSAELPDLQQQVASVVAMPLVGMLVGSACFPEAMPAHVLPSMQVRG